MLLALALSLVAGGCGGGVLSLEPPRAGRAYVIECSSYQIDLAPSLDPTVGILLNGISAALFASGRKGDLNVRAAFQHMLSDAVVSSGVLGAGAAYKRQSQDGLVQTHLIFPRSPPLPSPTHRAFKTYYSII